MISEEAEVRIGLNDKECGAMGVMRVAGTSGDTIQPPAEILYAVEPDGDATIRPSPCAVVTSWPSTKTCALGVQVESETCGKHSGLEFGLEDQIRTSQQRIWDGGSVRGGQRRKRTQNLPSSD